MSWTTTDHECYINTNIGKIKVKPRPHGHLSDVYIGNLGLFTVEHCNILLRAQTMAANELTKRAESMRSRMQEFRMYDALGQAIKLPLGNLRVRYSNERNYSIHLNQKIIAKDLDNFGLHVVGPNLLKQALANFIQQINELDHHRPRVLH